MARTNWTREELIATFNLYCKIPFSKINYRHPLIQQLALAIGRSPSAIAWKLVNFASLDPTLQARNITGAKHIGKLDKLIFDEFYTNRDEFVYKSEIEINKFLKKKDFNWNDFEIKDGKTKESVVKVRVNQSFFRDMILASYENKCCITGINLPDLLVASHIIPWAKDVKNRLNPENGLCLNELHDKAFDKGLITIDSNYRIKNSKYLFSFNNNENIKSFFLKYEDKQIEMPTRFLPNKDFLEYHRKNIFRQ